MRILLIQRHFWPDVGVPARCLRAVAVRLVVDGHEVAVLTGRSSYHSIYGGPKPARREFDDGIRVNRLSLPRDRSRGLFGRVIEITLFPVRVMWWLVLHGRRTDVFFVSSAPPVFLAVAVRLFARLTRRPYVYQCQDVNPEAAVLSGLLRDGVISRVMARLDRANVRRAAATVLLSHDMAETLCDRHLDNANLVVLNNFVVDEEAPLPSTGLVELTGTRVGFRVLFAGNLGLVQGLESVLEAARLLTDHKDIQFILMGTGAAESALRTQAGDLLGKSVVFVPHQPPAVASRAMREVDLGLVSLAPEIFRVAYPSKILAYLAAGCPVLAIVEPQSALARFVESTGVGTTCPPADPRALAQAILRQRGLGEAGRPTRAYVQSVAEQSFGSKQALDRWAAIFAKVGSRAPSEMWDGGG